MKFLVLQITQSISKFKLSTNYFKLSYGYVDVPSNLGILERLWVLCLKEYQEWIFSLVANGRLYSCVICSKVRIGHQEEDEENQDRSTGTNDVEAHTYFFM